MAFGFGAFRLFVFTLLHSLLSMRYNFCVKKLIQILFGIFLVTFPLSIRWVVYEQASYRFGNFNPWVTGFLYCPEVLLLVIFFLWFVEQIRNPAYRQAGPKPCLSAGRSEIRNDSPWLWGLFGLFALNAFVMTFLNGDPLLGALFILRLFEGLILFWLIVDKILAPKNIVAILLLSATLQILWGYFQIKNNGGLGLSLLGESVIGPDVMGVAKMELVDGAKQIRAYGSFLHSNILAAYLLVVFFLSLRYLKYGNKLFWLGLFTWGVYLTHSRAAMLAGGIGLIIYILFGAFKSISFRRAIGIISIILLVVGNFWFFQKSDVIQTRDLSWQERLDQNVMSVEMWFAHPFGVGVRNFTLEMEDVADEKLLPWEFQPVHNTYFLMLNEIGIQGLILFILFLVLFFDFYWKAGAASALFVLLFIMPFDHFLWDSWVGMMLVALVAGFVIVENHNEGLIGKVIHNDEH